MKLQELIDLLQAAEPSAEVHVAMNGDVENARSVEDADSYRGYYDHVALQLVGGGGLNADALAGELIRCRDAGMQGYNKGGQYFAHPESPVWVSPWGRSDTVGIVKAEIHGDRDSVTLWAFDLRDYQ